MDNSDNNQLTSIYNLGTPNDLMNSLAGLNIDFGTFSCKIVVPYLNRLYACSNNPGEECYSWDFYTGEKQSHAPLNDAIEGFCTFSVVEVNGKIWLTGGRDKNKVNLYDTYFLSPDFEWRRGPRFSVFKNLSL